tara:strand:+ start:2376 stop:3659 length:1284 start_codon:yes stop_codon:yes gene_type:complete
MILFYRVLTQLIYPFLFILIYLRVYLNKEHPYRYKEKILVSHFNVNRSKDKNLIWFHAASIGELKSILPIIKKINTDKNNIEFLVTTTTLSSSKIAEIEFKKIKNISHRFFPYDIEFLISKFLKLWKPNFIFLVDSEIWPNLILNAKKNHIPIAILNARITLKSFKNWRRFPRTASKIFSSLDLCLTSSKESENFFKKLNVKNIKFNGNIKFINDIEEDEIKNENEKILNNSIFWIAASTHPGEEELCLKTHKQLKQKYKKILTIIAPRHIERSEKISALCENYKLSFQILNEKEIIKPGKEIIILNSFGILQNYFKFAKSVFIGKSTIKKLQEVGGQSPLEAVKLKCKIYHGPYVSNFKDIYEILEINKISRQITNHEELSAFLEIDLNPSNKKNDNISVPISNLSENILNGTMKEINNFILNEIK